MKMIAHCGLDCEKCVGYIATQADDEQALARVAGKWSAQFDVVVGPEEAICDGICEIRRCCLGKGFATCIACIEFPRDADNFVLRHAPHARENPEGLK